MKLREIDVDEAGSREIATAIVKLLPRSSYADICLSISAIVAATANYYASIAETDAAGIAAIMDIPDAVIPLYIDSRIVRAAQLAGEIPPPAPATAGTVQ